MPPFKNERVLVTNRQDTKDIINQIERSQLEYEADYDLIYVLFDLGDLYATCAGIWNFLKYQVVYKAEPLDFQTTASPSAIVHNGFGVDCKHYSLFTAGILDSIKRNYNDPFEWCFRFVSETADKIITHVFVVVFDNATGREIWIDPVLNSFDKRINYTYMKDKYIKSAQIAGLYAISGLRSNNPTQISVLKSVAEPAFLHLVIKNAFNIKTLLNSDQGFLFNVVQPQYIAMGYDFNQLLNALK